MFATEGGENVMSVITDTTTIVKKRCKIQNETIPVTKNSKI